MMVLPVLLIYLVLIILGFYVLYLVVKTAIKNGINESDLINKHSVDHKDET